MRINILKTKISKQLSKGLHGTTHKYMLNEELKSYFAVMAVSSCNEIATDRSYLDHNFFIFDTSE